MQTEVDGALTRLGNAVRDTLGDAGAVVLYGSAARGEHIAGFSDLNVLVIGESLDLARLEALGRAFDPLKPLTRTPPLLWTLAEWARSADVFPIEIVDMQIARRVVVGEDPVAPLTVASADLRPALERELRGKLIRLRQGYAAYGGNPADLGRLAVRTVGTMAVLMRATLVLAGEPAPVATPTVLATAARRMGFAVAPLQRFFELRAAAEPVASSGEFAGYLAAVEAAAHFIDQFHVGGL